MLIFEKVGPFECFVNVKGRFHSWEWVWDGRFKCPELSSYEAGMPSCQDFPRFIARILTLEVNIIEANFAE